MLGLMAGKHLLVGYGSSIQFNIVAQGIPYSDPSPQLPLVSELIERRYAARSTVLCTQYTPAEWHGRLGGGVQADAMVDRLVHGAVRIDLGDVNVRRLLAEKK